MTWKTYIVIPILLLIIYNNVAPITNSIGMVSTRDSIEKTPTVIVYGSSECPACSGLKDFFNNNGIPYEFREIYDCGIQGCKLSDYGRDLAEIIGIVGLEPYIPDSVVINSEGYIVAIVQGSIKDKMFWEKLLSKNFSCGIEVYIEDQWGNIVLKNVITNPNDISKLVKIVLGEEIPATTIMELMKSCNTTTTTTSRNTMESKEDHGWQLIVITISVIIIAIVLVTVLSKRGR